MARFEVLSAEAAPYGGIAANTKTDVYLEMGLKASSGIDGATDFVAAHMWFNLAASSGNRQAAAYRQEIAAEMTPAEIAAAQRAAREWLATAH